MQTWLSPECSQKIQRLTAAFKVGVSLPLKTFQKLLGLKAASFFRSSSRSASYVAISILAKSLRPSLCMVNWMLQSQGDPQLRQHPGSLEIIPSVPVDCGSGLSLQNKGSCDKCLQIVCHLYKFVCFGGRSKGLPVTKH